MLTETKKRKLSRVMFSATAPVPNFVIMSLLQKLPEDTVLVTMMQEVNSGRWGWIVASEKFKEIKEGDMIPEIVIRADLVSRNVEVHMPATPEDFMSELGAL